MNMIKITKEFRHIKERVLQQCIYSGRIIDGLCGGNWEKTSTVIHGGHFGIAREFTDGFDTMMITSVLNR